MIRGTTPTLVFQLPFDAVKVKTASVVFAQNGRVVLEKKANEWSDKDIRFALTQEETFMFDAGIAQVQVRVLTQDGKAMATEINKVDVLPSLSNEVLR